jgi:hypothetical protein
MRLQQMKVALIRESGFPIGHPAPLYLNCPCGQRLYKNEDLPIVCTCGAEYDSTGWIVKPSSAVQS